MCAWTSPLCHFFGMMINIWIACSPFLFRCRRCTYKCRLKEVKHLFVIQRRGFSSLLFCPVYFFVLSFLGKISVLFDLCGFAFARPPLARRADWHLPLRRCFTSHPVVGIRFQRRRLRHFLSTTWQTKGDGVDSNLNICALLLIWNAQAALSRGC